MNLLVLSTLPHYLSVLPLIYYYNDPVILYYMFVILTSSTFSILYHSKKNNIIDEFDHLLALVWFLYDVYLGFSLRYTLLFQIIFYNTLSFMVYQRIEIESSRENYYILHSAWHLLNSYKSFYVSCLISMYQTR